ncbi:MAG: hypothetical protein P8184_12775 [Calditrichia bacterium]
MEKINKGFVLLVFLLSVGLGLGQTYHSITMDGSNDFTANYEEFPTSTPGYKAYCTWDQDNLYLGYSGPRLVWQEDDTSRIYKQFMWWYIDTDPQSDPENGNGIDTSMNVYINILTPPLVWYNLKRWDLPFNADYCLNISYPGTKGGQYLLAQYAPDSLGWGHFQYLDSLWINSDTLSGYIEAMLPRSLLGNPESINILGYILSVEWTSEVYQISIYPQRDIVGTYASWPPGSLDGGDGDKKTNGSLSQWFHYDFVEGINPNASQYFASHGVAVNAKVFLEGPYSNGVMNTALRDNGYLPLTQPYNAEPWNYTGTDSVASIPPGVVDWVLLELRTSPEASGLVATKAAFIKNNGSIVGLDGQFPVAFESLPDNYYLVVRHRNHLPIMSANLMALDHMSVLYDFSASLSQAYGISAMKDLGGSIFGLIAADANGNGQIQNDDKKCWIGFSGTLIQIHKSLMLRAKSIKLIF